MCVKKNITSFWKVLRRCMQKKVGCFCQRYGADRLLLRIRVRQSAHLAPTWAVSTLAAVALSSPLEMQQTHRHAAAATHLAPCALSVAQRCSLVNDCNKLRAWLDTTQTGHATTEEFWKCHSRWKREARATTHRDQHRPLYVWQNDASSG